MAVISAILSNPVLHPEALTEREKVKFKWHNYADDPRSSQVFCLSAFGTLRGFSKKDEIINSLFKEFFPGFGAEKWTIKPEASDRRLLGEAGNQPTSIDMLFSSEKTVICMESKYIEDAKMGFGVCGQSLNGNCRGYYGTGSDKKYGTSAWCRLENWDGRRSPRLYWSIGKRYFKPSVFQMQSEDDVCPFSGPNYQLMRNVLFAGAIAERKSLPSWGVAAICPNKNRTPLTQQVESFKEQILLPQFKEKVQLIHYEDYINVLRSYGNKPSKLGDFLQKHLP